MGSRAGENTPIRSSDVKYSIGAGGWDMSRTGPQGSRYSAHPYSNRAGEVLRAAVTHRVLGRFLPASAALELAPLPNGRFAVRQLVAALCIAIASLFVAPLAQAQDLSISPGDSLQSVLATQKGKRVTLRLGSGQELTGVLREATARLVVLGAVTGREFFDAAIPVEKIQAVLVRTKQ